MRFIQAFALSLIGAAVAFGQAAPTAPPSDNPNNPNVYMNRLPKVDKSKLRDIKGFVRDANEDPVEGAIVSLKDLKTGKIQSIRTGKNGSYLFYDLDMDQDYELMAKADDDSPLVTRKFTRFDNRKKPTIDFKVEKKAATAAKKSS